MKTFALIGAAGYIASRHMKAIKETGNALVAITDPSDSVGIIDSYFPNAKYFKEFERFDRHLDKLNRHGKGVDYVVVCSPNYLHDAHCRYGMRIGADVICEKPLVLNPWNIEGLKHIELQTDKKVLNILQLRLHPYFVDLKKKVQNGDPQKSYDVDLRYITARGSWYLDSWKGEASKSGGIATNIGIHLFDVLLWIFGDVVEVKVNLHSPLKATGYMALKQAKVNWFLSIDSDDLPLSNGLENHRSHRTITINQEQVNFDNGFEDLHTKSYQEILGGNGFRIEEVERAIDLVSHIRSYDFK